MITRVIQFSAKQFELSLGPQSDIIRQRKVHVIVGRLTTLSSLVSPAFKVNAQSVIDSFSLEGIVEQ